MRFLRRPRAGVRKVALFCGAFHPPTVAHVRLAEEARRVRDEVLWVMPERFPHKRYEGVALPQRLRLVLEATHDAVAVSEGQLFFEIAEEVENALPDVEVSLLLGEDGAQRLVEWDYGLSPAEQEAYLKGNLERYPVLSAARTGQWQPPEWAAPHIGWLETPAEAWGVSSTRVRESLERGEDWERLVPEGIRERVRELYGANQDR